MEGADDLVAIAEEWEQRHDKTSGQVYYVNLLTGESSWEAPAGFPADKAISSAHQWTEATDETGRAYFMNMATMETTWDPPPGFYSTTPESSVLRPSTAEQMDELNALLSGGDGGDDDGEELPDGTPGGGEIPPETPTTIIDGSTPIESTTAVAAEDGSEWMMLLNETDGHPYYYNHITGECVWEPPAAFLEYHAQLAEAEIGSSNGEADSNQGGEDAVNVRQQTPSGVPRPPQTPIPPRAIHITPDFEEKVRRAVETVSKTPVGSSRLLFVRTPMVKSLDSSRPTSRPTSSSGALARQKIGTARTKVEEEKLSKPVDRTVADENKVSAEERDEDAPEQLASPSLEPLDVPPSDEAIELRQREAMMLDLMREEMALRIQCLARCFLARARVARKRLEKNMEAKADTPIVGDMANTDGNADAKEQQEDVWEAHPIESLPGEAQMDGNPPEEQHGLPSDFSALDVPHDSQRDNLTEQTLPEEARIGDEVSNQLVEELAEQTLPQETQIGDDVSYQLAQELRVVHPIKTLSGEANELQMEGNPPEAHHGLPSGFSALGVSRDRESSRVTEDSLPEEAQIGEDVAPNQLVEEIGNRAHQPFEAFSEDNSMLPATTEKDVEMPISQSNKKTELSDASDQPTTDASDIPRITADSSSASPEVESVDVEPAPQGEEETALADTQGLEVTPAFVAVAECKASIVAYQHEAAGKEEVTLPLSDPEPESLEGISDPLPGLQPLTARLTPDLTETSALPLELPPNASTEHPLAYETAPAKPPSGDSSSPSARPSAQLARSGRSAGQKTSSRKARTPDMKPTVVDTNSSRLAILDIASFFPAHRRQNRSQPVQSKPESVKSSVLTGGITCKILSVDNSTPTLKTTEQREQERAARMKSMKEARDLAQVKWHEDVEKYREVFAASAQQFMLKVRDVSDADVARRDLTEAADAKWRSERSTIQETDTTSKDTSLSLWDYTRGEGTFEGAKARMQAAMDPQTFVRSMMRERLATINRVIERLKQTACRSGSPTDSCVYWQHLAQRFPPSFEEGAKVDDPYWARLQANLEAAITCDRDVAHEVTRYRTETFDSLLHAAAWRGDHDVVAFLVLDLRADVNAIDSSLTRTTPLHEACRGGHTRVVDFLLSHGAHLDATDIHGETPLHVSCRLGWTQVVHRLIEVGEAHDDSVRSNTNAHANRPESELPRGSILRRLTWIDCFHARNAKHRRAMDVATLPSLVEGLAQYSSGLQPQQSEALTSSMDGVVSPNRVAVKKKKTKPHRPKSAAKLNVISAR